LSVIKRSCSFEKQGSKHKTIAFVMTAQYKAQSLLLSMDSYPPDPPLEITRTNPKTAQWSLETRKDDEFHHNMRQRKSKNWYFVITNNRTI